MPDSNIKSYAYAAFGLSLATILVLMLVTLGLAVRVNGLAARCSELERREADSPENGVVEKLRVRELELVDSRDDTRARMHVLHLPSSGLDTAVLAMYSPQGKPRVWLSADEQANFQLSSGEANWKRFEVVADPKGATIELCDEFALPSFFKSSVTRP